MSGVRVVIIMAAACLLGGCAGGQTRQQLARLQSQVGLLDERMTQLERSGFGQPATAPLSEAVPDAGITVGSTTKNFSQGEFETTGVASDLAIDGSGFFITRDSHNQQLYTRDGAFSINPQGFLHDPSTGFMVQGVNADYTSFTIPQGGPLEDVRIPVGDLQIAAATTRAVFDGNLNSGGDVAHMGTTLQSAQLQDNVAVAAADATTLLSNL